MKGNQPTLFSAAKARLGNSADKRDFENEAHTEERASGELVRRGSARCRVEADDPEIDFPTARARRRQSTTRTRMLPGGTVDVRVEDRYCVTNEVMPAADALRLVRLHWGIENGPNWAQDVVLVEDAGTPCRQGHGVAAMSWLRRLAYNLLSMWRNKLPPVRDESVASWRRSMETLRTALLLLGDVPATLG